MVADLRPHHTPRARILHECQDGIVACGGEIAATASSALSPVCARRCGSSLARGRATWTTFALRFGCIASSWRTAATLGLFWLQWLHRIHLADEMSSDAD